MEFKWIEIQGGCHRFWDQQNILRLLENHGCDITIFPAQTTAKEILEFEPNGIFLSNGPGDPAAVTYGIETVQGLLGKNPFLVYVWVIKYWHWH